MCRIIESNLLPLQHQQSALAAIFAVLQYDHDFLSDLSDRWQITAESDSAVTLYHHDNRILQQQPLSVICTDRCICSLIYIQHRVPMMHDTREQSVGLFIMLLWLHKGVTSNRQLSTTASCHNIWYWSSKTQDILYIFRFWDVLKQCFSSFLLFSWLLSWSHDTYFYWMDLIPSVSLADG